MDQFFHKEMIDSLPLVGRAREGEYLRLILLILFLTISPCGWAMGEISAQDSLIGKTAYDAVLPQTDGTSTGFMKACRGKKAILVFWATWCPHCYEELGKINQAAASVGDKGIRIILIDLGEDPERVKEYLMRRKFNLSSFIDQDQVLHDPYQLEGIPTIFFIDQQGIIRQMTHQWPSDYEDYFIAS